MVIAVWMRNAPSTGPHNRTLGPWLVAPIGEDTGPLGRLAEGHHRVAGKLWESTASSHFQLACSASCVWMQMWSLSFLIWLPPPRDGLSLGTTGQNKLFICLFVWGTAQNNSNTKELDRVGDLFFNDTITQFSQYVTQATKRNQLAWKIDGVHF